MGSFPWVRFVDPGSFIKHYPYTWYFGHAMMANIWTFGGGNGGELLTKGAMNFSPILEVWFMIEGGQHADDSHILVK